MPKKNAPEFAIDGQTAAEKALEEEREKSLRLASQVRQLRRELTAARQLQEALARSRETALKLPAPPRLQPKQRRRKTRGDRTRLIFGDMHGSQMEPAVVEAILGDIQRLQPAEIVLLGDMVNCGGHLAEHHTLGYVAEIEEQSYEADIQATSAVLDRIQSIAPSSRIYYLEGNHEERVERWCVTRTLGSKRDAQFLLEQYSPQRLLRLKERGIDYYRRSVFYDGLPVPGTLRLDKCYFWHSTSSARHAASTNVARVGGNVVYGHTHRIQQDQQRLVSTGEISAWCPGCTCRLQPFWRHSEPTNWSHGQAIQLITPEKNFLHINVPIIAGQSLFLPLFNAL